MNESNSFRFTYFYNMKKTNHSDNSDSLNLSKIIYIL